MNIWEHWQGQKEDLRARLEGQQNMADVVHEVRRALLQTEQNALSEMSDDVLRQQAGVMMGCLKTSVGFLEAHMVTQIWAPQAKETPRRPVLALRLLCAAGLVFLSLYCHRKGLWLGTMLSAGCLALGAASCFFKPARTGSEETRVTLRPDLDRLFAILDGQLRAISRYVNDFAYLNDQLRTAPECNDTAVLNRAVDLLEALYECNAEERTDAEEAARRLLKALGLEALDYSDEHSRLFTALPSKSVTRTLSPAIVSCEDGRLLRLGTAAVRMDVA